MDYHSVIRELQAAMYPENRYLQNKICVHLQSLAKNRNRAVAEKAKNLLDHANELREPYNLSKELERPQNISPLMNIYEETINLISEELL